MMSTVKSNVYLTKLAENGYLEPTAVGATVGALTGSLVGGSLGISGGEMSLDTQKALNNIKADINKATNKIPLLKPNLMEITPVSRGEHLASGILKGMKYGAMAGIPLGGALFAYDNYRSNQEKKASVVNHLAHHAIDINLEQPPMNPYLQRVSDMQKEAEDQTEGYLPTFIQDTRGGMIGGGLIGGLLGTPRIVSEVSALRKAGTGLNRLQYVSRPLGLIAASGLLGGAAGAAASVPHYLFKQANFWHEVENKSGHVLDKFLPKTSDSIHGHSILNTTTPLAENTIHSDIKNGGSRTLDRVDHLTLAGLAATPVAVGAGFLTHDKGREKQANFWHEVENKSKHFLDKYLHNGSTLHVPVQNPHIVPTTKPPFNESLKEGINTGLDTHETLMLAGLATTPVAAGGLLLHNKGREKQAGVAEDQVRAKIHEDNAVIRPYHIVMTPEMNQAVESLAVGTGTHLAAKALGHVHPGFAAAAPGLGVAAGLLDATRLGDKLKADDAEKVRRYSAYIRNQAREDALKKVASVNPYLLKLAEQAESVPHDWKPALSAGAIDAGMGLGLGALGHHVSKKYFGGEYAPLIIGGTEGLAAMTATDLYQRKHERELAELKKGS